MLAEYTRDSLHREISRTQGALTESTGYDALGRVIARVTGALQDAFSYDAADNLQDVSAAWNNQPEQAGFYRYIYDEFGRIAQRRHLRDGSGQHYHYDSASRVVLVEFTRSRHYRQARYEYDALGRRTAKTLRFVRAGEPDIRTDFHWQGMRLSGEQTTGRALICHFYHGGSYTAGPV